MAIIITAKTRIILFISFRLLNINYSNHKCTNHANYTNLLIAFCSDVIYVIGDICVFVICYLFICNV